MYRRIVTLVYPNTVDTGYMYVCVLCVLSSEKSTGRGDFPGNLLSKVDEMNNLQKISSYERVLLRNLADRHASKSYS